MAGEAKTEAVLVRARGDSVLHLLVAGFQFDKALLRRQDLGVQLGNQLGADQFTIGGLQPVPALELLYLGFRAGDVAAKLFQAIVQRRCDPAGTLRGRFEDFLFKGIDHRVGYRHRFLRAVSIHAERHDEGAFFPAGFDTLSQCADCAQHLGLLGLVLAGARKTAA